MCILEVNEGAWWKKFAAVLTELLGSIGLTRWRSSLLGSRSGSGVERPAAPRRNFVEVMRSLQ